MIIVRLLSPEPVGWLTHHQLYSGLGADIVMESITLRTRFCSRLRCFQANLIASAYLFWLHPGARFWVFAVNSQGVRRSTVQDEPRCLRSGMGNCSDVG